MPRKDKLEPHEFGGPWEQAPLKEYVEVQLRGIQDGGQIESMSYEAVRVREAFARLLDILYSKGALTKPEVYMVIDGWGRETTEPVCALTGDPSHELHEGNCVTCYAEE